MTKERHYNKSPDYKKYCGQQSPSTSPLNQFTCGITDSICPKTRRNAKKCDILRESKKQGIDTSLDEGPDQFGGRLGGLATLHF